MEKRDKWAFILDKDQFVRLSLTKILKKYGFQVREIEDFSQLGSVKKTIKEGMILADVEVDALGDSLPILKRWKDRLILMSPLVTEELTLNLKKMGIHHIIKKPVEPKLLRKVIRAIFPRDEIRPSSGDRKRKGSRINQKGGEET